MNTTFRLSVVAVLAVVGVMACDTVPLTSPTGSSISLSVDKNVLPLGGQATVTAVVTESAGTPVHNGTVVTFQTTIGQLNPPEAATINGAASTTFLAGTTSGTATIHAFSGSARTGSGNASGSGVTVKIGAAAAFGAISVSASPSSVSQSGGTVTISALVLDEGSNPLPGVNVQFVASTGTLSATTATTDSTGIARTTLTTTQTAIVTAVAGAAKGETRVEVSTAPGITVNAPETGNVGTPVPITVTFSGPAGNVSPRQISTLTVDFGDGQSDTRSNVTGSVSMTHTYQQQGGYTITARAIDVAGNTGIASDSIVISPAPLPTITAFSANPNPIPAKDNGVTAITITAGPASAGGAPIRSVVVRKADGTVIFSGTQGGTFTYQFQPQGSGATPITATVTDANGNTATATTVVVVQ